ncbi:MAG: divalent metal cation transporter [Burkholderiales bacterium]
MQKALEIFLGIMTAVGGFVEVGELTFALNAGVRFGYTLLFVVAVGTVGIIVYSEMAGRVAAVARQPVFNVIRERVGLDVGLVTLVAALAVNLLTCAAEIGAIALLWQLAGGGAYRMWVAAAFAFLVLAVWVLPFKWIERVFGLGGLLLVIFAVVAWGEVRDWGEVAAGFVPQLPPVESAREYRLFAYYTVALVSSIMLPYETYFYAAGAIEDRWKPEDIPLNRVIAIVGSALGSSLCIALIVIGDRFFAPLGIAPQMPGVAALAAAEQFGRAGLFIALAGMFFAFAGAAIETALSGAYSLAQFLGWPWGKFRRPRDAPRFTFAWLATFLLAALVIASGVDPVSVVEYAIVFSVVILPLTYFPLLLTAGDPKVMGRHANGPVAKVLGWFYLALATVAGIAAIPLLALTHGGQG